jgi:hypothetical protein
MGPDSEERLKNHVIRTAIYDESSHKKYSTRAINVDMGNDSFGGRNYGNQPS